MSDESTLIEDLIRPSRSSLLDAVPRIHQVASAAPSIRAEFASRYAEALDKSPVPERERHLRFQRVVRMLELHRDGHEQLAATARRLSPGMQTAVVGLLPPELKPYAYADHGRLDSGPATTTAKMSLPPMPEASITAEPASTEGGPGERYPNATVLLLSAIEQEAIRRLLDGEDFSVISLKSTPELNEWLASSVDICAFLIDHSFLEGLTVGEQRELVRALASFSTFSWIRLDGSTNDLRLRGEEIAEIVRDRRCRLHDPCNHELYVATNSTLHARELEHIHRAARLLSHPVDGLFQLGNIDERQIKVLVGASATYAHEHFREPLTGVNSIRATLVDGGRSGDKVLVVRINGRGKPILTKIGCTDVIADEANRFRLFLQETQDFTPQLYFHGEAALLIYPLVSDDFEVYEPAPTLERCLRNLWLVELGFRPEGLVLTENDFPPILSRATRRLLSLNRRVPPTSDYPSPVSSMLCSIERLEAAGISFGFVPALVHARGQAQRVAERLATAATIHGDVQFRNLLVTSKADCELIDFQGVGPGHPATDLVRLELAFLLAAMKQTTGYDEFLRLQMALSLDASTERQLCERFPSIALSALNRVCLGGCVAARDAAIQAVRAYGGDERDYLAMKLVMAWQSLAIEELQHALARTVIEAISPVFSSANC